LSWAIAEWWHKGRPSALGAASGMVAGLATITPASGFVTVPAAFGIGLVAGVACYFAVTELKAHFAYDDSLDVFGVHGVGSIIGMLMLGGLASAAVNPAIASTFQVNGVTVSLAGSLSQIGHQAIGVLFTAVFAGLATFILFKLVDALVGLRVDAEDESLGLDLTQHGERAYSE
jgi:Amt family ammonium transporter